MTKHVKPVYWPSKGYWVVKSTGKGVNRVSGKGDTQFFKPDHGGTKVPPTAAIDAAEAINIASVTDGVITQSASGTVAAAVEAFINKTERRVADKHIAPWTGVNVTSNARSWLTADQSFAGMKCKDVTVVHIEAILDTAFAHLSPATRKHKVAALKGVFDTAHRLSWSKAVNPTSTIRIETARYAITEEEAEEGDFLHRIEPATCARLVSVALEMDKPKFDRDGEMVKPAWCDGVAVAFAIQTGLRFGEQAAMKWKSLDFEAATVRVVSAFRRNETGTMIEAGLPKTSSSWRSVFLTPELMAALKEWKLRSPATADEDRVFITRDGRHQVSSDNWRKRVLHPCCDRVKIDRLRWHDLRHIFASIAIAVFNPTVDADHAAWKTIATYMGHESDSTTRKKYVKWISDPKRDAEIASRFSSKLWAS